MLRYSIPRPRKVVMPMRARCVVRTRASIVEYSETIGRGLILFVLFASTLNWLHYKRLREEEEDRQ
jgi:hypothetical protein